MTETNRHEQPQDDSVENENPENGAPESVPENAAPESDQKIAALEKQLAETNDKMLRALAEAENTRRRAERERQDIAKFSIASFARNLLTVADNLRRALEAIPPEVRAGNEHLHTIYTGVEATERELLRALESNGIKKMDPLNQKFDPNLHEVMFETPDAGKEPGTIIQVIEPGYTIHERLLRPARVGVVKDEDATGGAHLDQEA